MMHPQLAADNLRGTEREAGCRTLKLLMHDAQISMQHRKTAFACSLLNKN